MKPFLLVSVLTILSPAVHAQKKLSGKVFDITTKVPLAGATVSLPGKNVVITGQDGSFIMDCTPSGKITISFVGYEASRILITNCDQELNIGLHPLSNMLDTVEITATTAQHPSLLYQSASIAKLGETELKRGNGLYLDDAINSNIPGMTMQRRGISSGQQFNIRGYGNGIGSTRGISSNFDGQGAKVYLNGIPVTDAEGITLMDDIDFASIGDVEVVKGPSGTLYGLAIAGVVNLKTSRPEKGVTTIGQDIMTGSYGLQRFTTRFQTATDRSSVLLNYGYQHSDGYMVHTASTKRFASYAGDFQLNNTHSISSYFGFSNSYDQRGGELTIEQYQNMDYSGNPDYIKRDAHSAVISFRAGLAHTYHFNQQFSNTTSVFGSGVTSHSSSAGGWTDKNPFNIGLRSVVNMKFDLADGNSVSSITGIETQHQYAQVIGYNMVPNRLDSNGYWVIGAIRSNQATYSGTTSFFTEWTLTLPHDLSVTGGIGTSSMQIELKDQFYVAGNTKPTHYQRSFSGMTSPHIAVNKIFSKGFSVYINCSRGYKAPASAYFFIPATGQLNTGLKPEIGDQIEVGSKGVLFHDRLSYQLALFDAQFKNKMTVVAVPLNSTTTAYSYIANGGRQDDQGIEALLKYKAYQSGNGFFRSVQPFANFAYSHFRYRDYVFQKLNTPATSITVVDYSDQPVAGVAPFTANMGVDLGLAQGIYANILYGYKDAMPISSNGLNQTTSYNLLNAKLGIRQHFCQRFNMDLFFGVNNITGAQYPNMVFVNQLPDAYLPAPNKANYFGGLNLTYQFGSRN